MRPEGEVWPEVRGRCGRRWWRGRRVCEKGVALRLEFGVFADAAGAQNAVE